MHIIRGGPMAAAAAVMIAVLVATATPAVAATADDVASIHTTDSDFNAGTLTNMAVEGSGSSAVVNYTDTEPDYNVVDDSGDGSTDKNLHQFVGDNSADTPIDSEFRIEPTRNITMETLSLYVSSTLGSDYGFTVDIYLVQETPDGTTGEGTLIKSNYDPSFSTGEKTISLDTSVDIREGETWTIEFETSGSDNDGSGDKLSIDVDDSFSGDWYWSNDRGFDSTGANVSVSGSALDNGTYVSATHDADEVTKAWVDLELSNAVATVQWQYYDGSSWVTQTTTTYSSSGNKTVTWSEQGTSKWRVNVSISDESGTTTAKIEDDGVLFDASDPQLDASAASPNGTTLTTNDPTLEIAVDDSDFATSQGDTVDVAFFVKKPGASSYSKVGTDTVSQNTTAAYTYDATLGGDYDWYAKSTDSYGNTDSTKSANANFTVPGSLEIRNVSNTSELVDAPVTVEVRFFGENITTETTTTGRVDLSGLPVDEAFIVEIRPDQDYYERTVYIEDIYSQDTVYILNNTKSSVESRFELDDPTGEYGSNSLIFIQKPVNNTTSGTTEYVTVHADKFGVEGVTALLEQNGRYRIKIKNEDGQAQIVGPYRADKAETVQVQPGNPQVGLGNYTNGWTANATITSNQIEYVYSDQFNDTVSLTVWVHEKGNTSNQLGPNQTYTNLGTASGTYSLTSNESETTWVVNFQVDRNGKQFAERVEVSNRPDLVPQLDREWRLIAAVLLMLISAGVFSMLNAGVGGVIVALEGGMLWYTGWLTGATSAAGITLALLVAGLAHVYTSRGP